MVIRQEQKEQRRQEILFAALDLFVKKGYAATKISDIAQAVQMSDGLLFHYFKSKEALYEELVKIGLEGTKAPFQIAEKEPLEVFTIFVDQLLLSFKEQPWIGKMFILMAQTQRNGAAPQSIRELAMQVNTIELSTELIKYGQANGSIRKGDPLALSNTFWSSIQGIMEQLAANPSLPFPETSWIIAILKENKA